MTRRSYKQLATLFHRTGVSLEAGVDIVRVWETERNRSHGAWQQQLERLTDRLKAGESLADSMESSDGAFPPMAVEMIRVGETTGRLEPVLRRLGDHYQHLAHLQRDFLVSLQWPALQFVAAVGVVALLIFIMGLLPSAGESGPIDLLGLGLRGFGGMLIFLILVAMFLGLLFGVGYSLAQGWWGPKPIMLAMRVPILGDYLESMALSRFCWSLAVAIDVGMEPRESMRMALRSTQNPVYLFRTATADRLLKEHAEFWEAMEATGRFPAELVEIMQTAELSGTHTETLLHQAQQYDERFQAAARTLSFATGVIIRVAVGLLLIALIFRLAGVYLGALYDAANI
jgi:type II secretory pathway component PulF